MLTESYTFITQLLHIYYTFCHSYLCPQALRRILLLQGYCLPDVLLNKSPGVPDGGVAAVAVLTLARPVDDVLHTVAL